MRFSGRTSRSRQSGVAGLLLVLILLVGVTGWLVSGLSSARIEIEKDKQTADALARAKEALIGWAAAHQSRPGVLPCPDLITNILSPSPPPPQNIPNDGVSDLLSGNNCPSYLGRLPWRTLGLPDLRDGAGERLWYALSNTVRNDDSAQPVNSETKGTITVRNSDGTRINDGADLTAAIAVVISPGAVLTRNDSPMPQDRNPGSVNINIATNYLDVGNGEDNADFLHNSNGNGFINGPIRDATDPGRVIVNDSLLAITHNDLFSAIERRVLKEVENVLNDYYNMQPAATRVFPTPALFTDTTCLGTTLPLGPPNPCQSAVFGITEGRIPAHPSPTTWPRLLGETEWFQANGWRELIYYAVAPACSSPSCSPPPPAQFLTLLTPGGPVPDQKVVLIAAAQLLPNLTPLPQSRTALNKINTYNYIEGENRDAVSVYDFERRGTISAGFNDRAVSIP